MNSPESTNLADVTLAVLAGGAGVRMGRPKALLHIGDEPILSWLLRRIAWPGPTLLVTAPAIERPPGAEHFKAHAIDPVDGNGPLQGVHTALRAAGTAVVIVITVDMPGVDLPMLRWLVDQLMQFPKLDALMTRRVEDDLIEPFPSAWRRSAAEAIEQRLLAGNRSVHRLVGATVAAVPAPADWPSEAWANLNFPQDFQVFINAQDQTRLGSPPAD